MLFFEWKFRFACEEGVEIEVLELCSEFIERVEALEGVAVKAVELDAKGYFCRSEGRQRAARN
jgi:hypothetical protein